MPYDQITKNPGWSQNPGY
ncbi:MAG: hypothetical protein LBD89_08970 [Tannerellaceae bacterium]|nr:hypothetical protein [Tannerellaceae bacterium]